MHIRKYDFNYGRRALLEKVGKGAATAGVLTPLWPMLAKADTLDASKAYPDELTSIEVYTKGKVKPGDVITSNNVEYVKDLLSPVTYGQVLNMGRKIKIVKPVDEISKLYPRPYLEATLRNHGKAVIDDVGNVRNSDDGGPWIGGNPFPDAKNGFEAMMNLTLCWGRHDYSQYALRHKCFGSAGDLQYAYDFLWTELNTTARSDGKTLLRKGDKLRYNDVIFTAPNSMAGTSFLSIWEYDQRDFPALLGYLPAFKRVREYPANQRFEPIAPGMNFFLSDAWGAGDPALTWGNYKIVWRGPMLAPISQNWWGKTSPETWEPPSHGGGQGETFYMTRQEMVPEAILVESEPTSYPRAPIGKRWDYIDVRNGMLLDYLTFDRKRNVWRGSLVATGQMIEGDTAHKDHGDITWSVLNVAFHDVQSGRYSAFYQAKEIEGGYKSMPTPVSDVAPYQKFMTVQALRRLGA